MEGSTVVEPVHGLARNALGLPQVLFCIVTGAAPIAAMLFNDFWAVYGGGWAAPSAFIMATLAFTIFSVGYVAMARRVTAAGGFYSFVSHAFGQSLGMGTALLITACYTIFAAGVTGVTAYFANATFNDWFSVDIPVWVWEFGTLAIMVILAYFHIELTARILGVFLMIEVAALLVFGFATLFQPKHGLVFDSLLPWNFFDSTGNGSKAAFGAGTVGAGFFGAFWSWIGFEMAPNYAEESRDPKRIIPQSLLISVIGLGLFYTFVSWCAVAAYPTEADMVAKAFSDGVNFFLTPVQSFVGGWGYQLMSLLILTSSFACGMAFHNTASRYLYSLAREGVLPQAIAETHDHHKSPHKASALQSVLAAVWVLLYGLAYGFDDPSGQAWLGVYTLFAVLGTGLLLVLQAVVSLAIYMWFKKNGGGSMLTTVIAPLISLVVQLVLVYTLVANLATLGGTNGFARSIPYVGLAILIVGLIWGFVLKSANPKAYENIGHMVNEG